MLNIQNVLTSTMVKTLSQTMEDCAHMIDTKCRNLEEFGFTHQNPMLIYSGIPLPKHWLAAPLACVQQAEGQSLVVANRLAIARCRLKLFLTFWSPRQFLPQMKAYIACQSWIASSDPVETIILVLYHSHSSIPLMEASLSLIKGQSDAHKVLLKVQYIMDSRLSDLILMLSRSLYLYPWPLSTIPNWVGAEKLGPILIYWTSNVFCFVWHATWWLCLLMSTRRVWPSQWEPLRIDLMPSCVGLRIHTHLCSACTSWEYLKAVNHHTGFLCFCCFMAFSQPQCWQPWLLLKLCCFEPCGWAFWRSMCIFGFWAVKKIE